VADFSKQLNDLILLSDMQGDRNISYPRDTVCQVAYVSGRSKLVSSLLSKHKKLLLLQSKNNDTVTLRGNSSKLTFWNGRLVHNGWTVLWLKHHDKSTMTEAEYMMPKIAPASLFATNVTRAIYLEPEKFVFLPLRPVMWYLMAKQLDSKFQMARLKHVRGRDELLPSEPPRHAALFAHDLYASPKMVLRIAETVDATSYLNRMAKYILLQKGLGVERMWPRRQLEFYAHLMALPSHHGAGTVSFQLRWPDTFLLIHKLQSDRSRRLRCEWYEEQLFWNRTGISTDVKVTKDGRNRDLEEISLAYVLAKMRMEKRLVPDDSAWGE
jgi:hypothetical protein